MFQVQHNTSVFGPTPKVGDIEPSPHPVTLHPRSSDVPHIIDWRFWIPSAVCVSHSSLLLACCFFFCLFSSLFLFFLPPPLFLSNFLSKVVRYELHGDVAYILRLIQAVCKVQLLPCDICSLQKECQFIYRSFVTTVTWEGRWSSYTCEFCLLQV